MCIIVSLILRGEKKFEENLDLANNAAYLIKIGLSKPKKPTGFFVVDQNLIFREKYRNDDVKNSMFFIFIIISVYVVLEQINILFKKIFVHMYFWMVAILNSKIFKIQIFRNQKLALLIYFISVILNLIVVVLKIGEKKEEKALYVKYWWTLFIALPIYILYSFYLSYIYINIKKLIDLKFIQLYVILLVYGIFGLLFYLVFCIIAKDNNWESSIS